MKGLFYGDGGQLVAQIFHLVIGFVWAFGVMWVVIMVTKRFMQIRVSAEAELAGLDEPEFGSVCYPDFVLVSSSVGGAAAAAPRATQGPAPSDTVTVTT